MSLVHQFEDDVVKSDLAPHVAAIVEHTDAINDTQLNVLMTALEPRLRENQVEYGAEFDIMQEISSMIQMVRAMRKHVLNESGSVKEGIDTRALKEVISASNTLAQMLIKSQNQILSADRQRAMEAALRDAIMTLDKERQDVFFETLENLLEKIE